MSHFGIKVLEANEEIIMPYAIQRNSKMVELHDWQRRAIEYFFLHDNKILLEVTTGAGKTYCAIEILKEILKIEPDLKCLIVCPKNVIMETSWYKELYDAGFSLPDIGIYYGMGKEYSKITITNMQSIDKVALEVFDMIILDEVHNYCTKRLFPYVEHPFKYKLGLSATIERMDSAHWQLMKAFNYNIFKYSPQQAIKEGILNPFNFYNIGVEMDSDTYEDYLQQTEELNRIMLMGGGFGKIMRANSGLKMKMLSLMNKRKQLVNNYVRKFDVARIICKKHKGDKTLIFNQYNSQTSKLYWHLLEEGLKARIVHSDINKQEREQTLIDFRKDKFNILLASKVLDEGFNLPSISCAIIMAGDSSAKQTIQRMGRVLRKKEKESVLYQVYCKGTIEEEQAIERAKLFKQLASHYKDYNYAINKELVLE